MNLTMAPVGETLKIIKLKGRDKQQKQMSNLGFVEGASVSVVTEMNGNLIVNVKDSRVAIGKELANRILVANA
ncbi:MAG: ferrous iron transport protein A [Tissierellia bacterium]|nr:ferrous iron transport protein A [Tissierellia bacterium]